MTQYIRRLLVIALAAIAFTFTTDNNVLSQDTLEGGLSKLQAPLQLLYTTHETGTRSAIGGFDQALTSDAFSLENEQSRSLPAFNIRDNSVQIVVQTSGLHNSELVQAELTTMGGSVESVSNNMIQAFVPIDTLQQLAFHDYVEFVRLPIRVSYGEPATEDVDGTSIRFAQQSQEAFLSEGVAVIGADQWTEFGLDGNGVKVGILDQFGGYRALIGTELPSEDNVTIRSFAQHGEIFNPNREEEFQDHGTNVGEIIFDIAPGASHHVAYFETAVEFSSAIRWLIDEEVDVVNTSVGFHSGCFQGDGIFESQFRDAKESGITWATASGNEADQYIRFDFKTSDEDEFHNFTDTDNDNSFNILVREATDDNDEPIGIASISAIYSWDAPCRGTTDDYEIIATVEEDGEVIELEEFGEAFNDWAWEPGRPIKFFSAFRNFDADLIGETVRFNLAVRKRFPEAEDATISIDHFCICGIQHVSAEGSVGIIEPSVSPSAFTIGAAHHSLGCSSQPTSFISCPDGRLLFYSSQGPTPDGRTKPDITAPTHVTTRSAGRWEGDARGDNLGFTGTSAATPHAAGAMALVTQALLLMNDAKPTPDEVFAFLTSQSEDVGEPGFDNQYGVGLLFLGQPPDVEIPIIIEAELSASAFASVQFINSEDWERTISQSCIIYTNTADDASPIRVTLTNGEVRELLIPTQGQVWICDNVIHIDTRTE